MPADTAAPRPAEGAGLTPLDIPTPEVEEEEEEEAREERAPPPEASGRMADTGPWEDTAPCRPAEERCWEEAEEAGPRRTTTDPTITEPATTALGRRTRFFIFKAERLISRFSTHRGANLLMSYRLPFLFFFSSLASRVDS